MRQGRVGTTVGTKPSTPGGAGERERARGDEVEREEGFPPNPLSDSPVASGASGRSGRSFVP